MENESIKYIPNESLVSDVLGYKVEGLSNTFLLKNSFDILPLFGKINKYELVFLIRDFLKEKYGIKLNMELDIDNIYKEANELYKEKKE
jgi:hypothetical protein